MKLLLEGISGAGKTSQLERLKRRLRAVSVVETIGEFSRGPIGQTIRRSYRVHQERFIRFHSVDRFADQTHFLLLADAIAKAEEMSRSTAGVLLIDRLFDSWLCYTLGSGKRRRITDASVKALHRRCSREHVASDVITVFLEIDVLTALERIAIRDGFELKPSDRRRLEATAQQFADLYADALVMRIDAGRPPAVVTSAILEVIGLKI